MAKKDRQINTNETVAKLVPIYSKGQIKWRGEHPLTTVFNIQLTKLYSGRTSPPPPPLIPYSTPPPPLYSLIQPPPPPPPPLHTQTPNTIAGLPLSWLPLRPKVFGPSSRSHYLQLRANSNGCHATIYKTSKVRELILQPTI